MVLRVRWGHGDLQNQTGRNRWGLEDQEVPCLQEDLYSLEDLSPPDLGSLCRPSLPSVRPARGDPAVREDLGVLESLVVLEDHQNLHYQADLEVQVGPGVLEDQRHLESLDFHWSLGLPYSPSVPEPPWSLLLQDPLGDQSDLKGLCLRRFPGILVNQAR